MSVTVERSTSGRVHPSSSATAASDWVTSAVATAVEQASSPRAWAVTSRVVSASSSISRATARSRALSTTVSCSLRWGVM